MPTKTLEAPRAVGGGTITVTTKHAYGHALAVTRVDQPKRLLMLRYFADVVDVAELPAASRALAADREQSVHLFALGEHTEHGRWLGTFHADGTTTTSTT